MAANKNRGEGQPRIHTQIALSINTLTAEDPGAEGPAEPPRVGAGCGARGGALGPWSEGTFAR